MPETHKGETEMARFLDETLNLYPACSGFSIYASRGQVYAVLRELGESDFIAGSVALSNRKETHDCEPTANRAAIAVWWGGGKSSEAFAAQCGVAAK